LLSLFVLYTATLILIYARWNSAARSISQTRILEDGAPPPHLQEIMVVQPILGGDPSLESNLAHNIALYPDIRFLWLIDDDDKVGMAAAERALISRSHQAKILRTPKGDSFLNPKVFKLNYAFSQLSENFIVLDDDCQLREGSLERLLRCLYFADLATGIPFYRETGGLWSLLLAKFPNGQSALTYFSTSSSGPASTINGMYYATSRTALNTAGGFSAIGALLCDDYELARIFVRKNLKIWQSTAQVNIFTYIPSAKAYFQQMHRWAFFSVRQVTALISPKAIIWVLLPTILPFAGLISTVLVAPHFLPAMLAILALKSESSFQLRRQFFGATKRGRVDLEILTDLMLPIFVAVAAVSRRVKWRNKIILSDGRILKWHT